MRPIIPTLAALALTIATPALAQDYDASTPMATVNGKVITLGHMIALYEGLPEQYEQLGAEVLFPGILDQLIDQALISDVVSADAASDPLRVRLSLDNQRWSTLSNLKINELTDGGVPDADLQAAYDEKYGNQPTTREFNASHILLDTAEEAQAVLEMVEGGADFAETAAEKSTGPSGPNGGQLGWFGPGAMVGPFDAAVQEMEVGALAGPVQTQFGWHIIKLNDARDLPPPSLDDVRAELTDELLRAIVEVELNAMRDAATVERHAPLIPAEAIRESELIDGE